MKCIFYLIFGGYTDCKNRHDTNDMKVISKCLLSIIPNPNLQKIGPKRQVDNNNTWMNNVIKPVKILLRPIPETFIIRTPVGAVLYIVTCEYILLLVTLLCLKTNSVTSCHRLSWILSLTSIMTHEMCRKLSRLLKWQLSIKILKRKMKLLQEFWLKSM